MSKTLLVLDIMAGALAVMNKSQALFQKAVSEGRDVTDDELKELQDANDVLEREILSS